jgi:hypothetical protein
MGWYGNKQHMGEDDLLACDFLNLVLELRQWHPGFSRVEAENSKNRSALSLALSTKG